MLILGNGGHASVVSEACRESGGQCECSDSNPPQGTEVFIGIGDNHKRFDLCLYYFPNLPKIIHPKAYVSPSAHLDEGVFVAAHAVVGTHAVLGLGVIVNTGATVDHDCIIHSAVHISPGVHLGGNVTVHARTWIGIGASVKHGITIGKDVIVGAGAVVVKDIPDCVTVTGVPAK